MEGECAGRLHRGGSEMHPVRAGCRAGRPPPAGRARGLSWDIFLAGRAAGRRLRRVNCAGEIKFLANLLCRRRCVDCDRCFLQRSESGCCCVNSSQLYPFIDQYFRYL